jgi:c-di-GMP-binding flagellar brake protein YcgR
MNSKPHVGIAKFEKDLEKRLYPRFLLNLPIEYQAIDSPTAAQGHTVNASQGGLMVCLRERFQKGQHIGIKLFFSAQTGLFTIETKVEVMWADPNPGEDGHYRYGVKFVDIPEEHLQMLKSFLDGLSPNLMT